MTPEARARLEAAAPDLLAAAKFVVAEAFDRGGLEGIEISDEHLDALKVAIAKAETGPLMAKVLRRRAIIQGMLNAKVNGRKAGRPGFVMTPARRTILGIWLAGEPREPLRVLAEALKCSKATASRVAREEL